MMLMNCQMPSNFAGLLGKVGAIKLNITVHNTYQTVVYGLKHQGQ